MLVAALALLALLSGCAGGAEAPDPQAGWVEEVVAGPERFTALIADHREGWVALHRNDWISALSEGGAPARRAAAELARLYRVLGGLSDAAWMGLGAELEARRIVPAGSLLPLFVRFAADQAGAAAAAERWQGIAEGADKGADKGAGGVARAFHGIRAPGSPGSLQGSLAERLRLHQGLRGEGPPPGDAPAGWSALRAVAPLPVLLEPLPGGGSRALYDPLVYRSLQAAMEREAADLGAAGGQAGVVPRSGGVSLPIAGLEAVLFSGDLGETAAGLSLPTQDDMDGCRDLAQRLDERLEPRRQRLAEAAGDGRALLEDLRLLEGARARWLVDRAEEALATRPRCAWALASLAMDHNHGRAVGPINSPTLFAVMAAASFQLGHRREAMDTLQVLVDSYPEVVPLDETIGDLVVLDAMGRSGDSKEH